MNGSTDRSSAMGHEVRLYLPGRRSWTTDLLSAATSGVSIQMTHPAKAVVVDGVTPMEATFNVEMAHAAAKINRAGANQIVNPLLEKYEGNIDKAPRGKIYRECFDMKTGKANSDYVALVEEVMEALKGMGVY